MEFILRHARTLTSSWYHRTRGGHSSLPSTAALTGGIAAQEIVKLLTRQYIPADNTIVYNGIQQSVGVFRL